MNIHSAASLHKKQIAALHVVHKGSSMHHNYVEEVKTNSEMISRISCGRNMHAYAPTNG